MVRHPMYIALVQLARELPEFTGCNADDIASHIRYVADRPGRGTGPDALPRARAFYQQVHNLRARGEL